MAIENLTRRAFLGKHSENVRSILLRGHVRRGQEGYDRRCRAHVGEQRTPLVRILEQRTQARRHVLLDILWTHSKQLQKRLEAARIVCFRRVRLVKLLAGASANAETVDAAIAAQCAAVADEFGWDATRADHKTVLDALQTPGRAVYTALSQPDGADAAVDTIAADLAAFESWYQAHAGQSFYALFDQYVPQAPLVDF